MTVPRLQQQRERLAIARERVAQTLGIPEQLLSLWETGDRNPGLYQLEQLARLYRVNIGYLLGKEDLQEPPADPKVSLGPTRVAAGMLSTPGARKRYERDREALRMQHRWLAFLDNWAEFLEDLEKKPLKPFPPLEEEDIATDSAPTLAAKVRQRYGLGMDALPDLSVFLDLQGVLIYRASLGKSLAGDSCNHRKLGCCILLNSDTTPGHQTFTLAREWFRSLEHPGNREGTDFADAFARHFLAPGVRLRRSVENARGRLDAYKAVRLAAYFRTSYPCLLDRLREENLIPPEQYRQWSEYSSAIMAPRIGLDASWFQVTGPPYLERYPVSVLEQVKEAIEDLELTPSQAAGLLDLDVVTVQTKLLAQPPLATSVEEREVEAVSS